MISGGTSKAAEPESVAVIGRYFNQQGGVSNVMAQLAQRAALTYDVSVLAHEFLDWPAGRMRARPTPMVENPRWLQIPSFVLSAKRSVRRGSFSLVHSHDPQALNADIYTAHSCFKYYIQSRRRVATTLHRNASRVYLPHLSSLMLGHLAYDRTKAHIAAVSGSVRNELLASYDLDPAKVTVIHNGVDVQRFSRHDRHDARASLSLDVQRDLRGKIVLAFVGYEFKRKRLATVLHALASAQAVDRLHLLVVGGADASDFQQLARSLDIHDRVSFLGHREDVEIVLRAADIFAFPTQYEAASLAILEAAAAGLAIVTTDTAMAGEVFTDGEDALLLPNTDDPAPLRAALDRLATNHELRVKLQVQASLVAGKFSWDSAWEKYAQLYREILDQKARR